MADHRGRLRPRRVLGAAIVSVVAAALLIGAQGSGAYWTDSGSASVDPLTAASLDITLRPGTDGTFADSITLPAAALDGMLPGDSRAFNLAVRSDGDAAPLTYQILGRSSASAPPNTDVLGNALQTQIRITGGAATNPGNGATGYRTDQFGTSYDAGCPAGEQIGPKTSLSVGSDVALTDIEPVMQPGDVDDLCVLVTLPDDVAGAAMDKATTILFTVTARSVER